MGSKYALQAVPRGDRRQTQNHRSHPHTGAASREAGTRHPGGGGRWHQCQRRIDREVQDEIRRYEERVRRGADRGCREAEGRRGSCDDEEKEEEEEKEKIVSLDMSHALYVLRFIFSFSVIVDSRFQRNNQ